MIRVILIISIVVCITENVDAQDYAEESQRFSQALDIQLKAGPMLIGSNRYKEYVNSVGLTCVKSQRITPWGVVSIRLLYKKFEIKVEQVIAIPSFGLGFELAEFKDKKLYVEADFTSLSPFFKDFWSTRIGKGGGIRMQREYWSYKAGFVNFLNGLDVCQPRFRGYPSNWVYLEFSRNINLKKKTKAT